MLLRSRLALLLPSLVLAGISSCSDPTGLEPNGLDPTGSQPNVGASQRGVDAAGRDGEHVLVLCGHLYSLFAPTKIEDGQLFGWETPMKTFAQELERIAPERTIFLGDNTRYSRTAEWDYLEETFADVPGEKTWVVGNHDYRGIEEFRRRGGLTNSSFVVGNFKFVTLDAKSILEEHDLRFLDEQLADHEDYEEVFILMHFMLAPYADPPADYAEDPYKEYTGYSNWNRDAVPLLAGRVNYVFVGDFFKHHVRRTGQVIGEHRIEYIQNAFLFGRGRGTNITGDGFMTFLELRLGEDEFRILPHMVPLDLLDPWYENFTLLRSPWLPQSLAMEDVELELPADWVVLEDEPTQFTVRSGQPVEWKRCTFTIRRHPELEPATRGSLITALEEGRWSVEGLQEAAPFASIDGAEAPWRGSLATEGKRSLVSVAAVVDGRAYTIDMAGVSTKGGTPELLMNVLAKTRILGRSFTFTE